MIRRWLPLCAYILLSAPVIAAPLSDADRQAVLQTSAQLLEARYVDPEKAQQIARQVRESGDRWRGMREAESFAKAMTLWLREISGDGHLALEYSATRLPENSGEEAFSQEQLERWYGAHVNHGVQKVERLADNVMLIDLRVFPPPSMAGDMIAAMMTLAAQGSALIIDLRANGGGMETMNLLTGYLLPPNSPLSGMYDRPSDTHIAQTSPSWVPGRRFGETKPVYILTSKRTFSAAEALAYDLQALKRATVVGEVTGGGANPFEYRRIHAHFALSLPEKRSVNPITGANWQGVGVQPDVTVPAASALDKALELAQAAIKTGT